MYAHAYFSCIYAHDTPPRVQHFSAFHFVCTRTLRVWCIWSAFPFFFSLSTTNLHVAICSMLYTCVYKVQKVQCRHRLIVKWLADKDVCILYMYMYMYKKSYMCIYMYTNIYMNNVHVHVHVHMCHWLPEGVILLQIIGS